MDYATESCPFAILMVQRGITEIKSLLTLVGAYDCFVGGGYARYCLSPLPKPAAPSDVDLFCKTEEAYESIISTLKERGAKVKVQTLNATTIVPPEDWIACPMIQVISPTVKVGDPWSIISTFDFTIAIAALSTEHAGIAHKDFEDHEYKQILVINYIQCPVGNMRRALKYIKKGYRLPVKEMIKFYEDWMNKPTETQKEIMDLMGMAPDQWTEQTRERFRDLIYID